jgi:hypothetical protein
MNFRRFPFKSRGAATLPAQTAKSPILDQGMRIKVQALPIVSFVSAEYLPAGERKHMGALRVGVYENGS